MIIDKDNIKILLIILILGLGIGYSYINSDLNINGTAQVNSANWDVHWANIQVTNGSVSASSPTISNQTTVNYSVVLNTPGDYYEFTVDAVNGGSIDAMIDTIDSKLNGATITELPDYLRYMVTYEDGVPLEANHQLLHNTAETYKVRIEYKTNISVNQLPTTDQTLSLQFTVTYRQANENAIIKPELFYVDGFGSTEMMAADGMTWQDWIESDYNYPKFSYIEDKGVGRSTSYWCGGDMYMTEIVIVTDSGEPVGLNDTIEIGHTYGTQYEGGMC